MYDNAHVSDLPGVARARYAKNVKKWQWVAGGFVFLVVVGSCMGNDDKTDGRAETATAQVDLDTAPILAGTVTEVDSPHVSIDVGSRYPIKILLAHTGQGTCSGMSDAYGKRLVAALPIGSEVTLVRTPEDAGSTKMGDKSFVHLATAGPSASAIAGPSVNELVIASGDGVFLPSLDHQRDAAPIDEQLPALLPQVSAVAEPYVDAMVAAEIKA
ncbi:hypothetical protein [Rhodococcus sp. O3]|uniref:hypothetical protein n=1 Tax=Rhodococcus sp. O3 TaxID=3404919 RepID=UPI003B67A5BF